MEDMNVAVIGLGYWGKKIVSEYASISKVDHSVSLLGVCDVFDENLKFCKEKYNVPYLARTSDEILLNPKIDAVHI